VQIGLQRFYYAQKLVSSSDLQHGEVLRNCGPGAWTRFVRRTAPRNQLWRFSSTALTDRFGAG